MPLTLFYAQAQTAAAHPQVNPFRCQGFVRGGSADGHDDTHSAIQSLPAFLRALLVTDGTVTKILEAYFWEPVLVDTLSQQFTVAEAEIPWIGIRAGDRALVRRVRLRGEDSGNEYAQADSLIRAERVPDHFRRRLIDGEIGIGALIRDSGLESYREVMEVGVHAPGEDRAFRTYRIIIGKEPVILITETFPLALFGTCGGDVKSP